MFETTENYKSEYIENSIKEKMQQESLSELLVKFADGYVKCEMKDGNITHSKVELIGSGNKIVELNLPIVADKITKLATDINTINKTQNNIIDLSIYAYKTNLPTWLKDETSQLILTTTYFDSENSIQRLYSNETREFQRLKVSGQWQKWKMQELAADYVAPTSWTYSHNGSYPGSNKNITQEDLLVKRNNGGYASSGVNAEFITTFSQPCNVGAIILEGSQGINGFAPGWAYMKAVSLFKEVDGIWQLIKVFTPDTEPYTIVLDKTEQIQKLKMTTASYMAFGSLNYE